jgi:REP element-mobilizing transposase RayT
MRRLHLVITGVSWTDHLNPRGVVQATRCASASAARADPPSPRDMSQYRRLYQPAGCYFFTVITHQRLNLLCLSVILSVSNLSRSRASRSRALDLYPTIHYNSVKNLTLLQDTDQFSPRIIRYAREESLCFWPLLEKLLYPTMNSRQ